MNEISKKDLLELRMLGLSSIQKGGKILGTSGSDNDSNVSKNLINNENQPPNDESQKSQVDSQGSNSRNGTPRGRKRKSTVNETDKKTNIQNFFETKLGNSNIISMSTLVANSTSSNKALLPCSMTQNLDMEITELRKRYGEIEFSLRQAQISEKRVLNSLEESKNWIKLFLIKECQARRKCVSESLIDNYKRLGQYNIIRKGSQLENQWQDGSDFKRISELIVENNNMKDELEKFKRLINRRKPNERAANLNSPGEKARRSNRCINDEYIASESVIFSKSGNQTLTLDEYHKWEELYKTRLSLLKKEESDICMEHKKLVQQRNLHIKEIKRANNEDMSRFNNNPVLNNRYILLDMLGKGGFSEVYKAFDLNDFRYTACKIHQLFPEWKEEQKANYIKHSDREYQIHKTLDHPNIVKMLDMFEIDNNSFVTIMEFCDGNDLDFLVKQYEYLPEREARTIIIQVVSALKYLNERSPPIIHYDLKPANVLLLSGINSWHVKLTDFGLSKILPSNSADCSMDLTSPFAGTYWYLPPECFAIGFQPAKISSKVDVWSIGVIFFECLYGKRPFGNNLSQASILEQNVILNATNIDFPAKPSVSNEAKVLFVLLIS